MLYIRKNKQTIEKKEWKKMYKTTMSKAQEKQLNDDFWAKRQANYVSRSRGSIVAPSFESRLESTPIEEPKCKVRYDDPEMQQREDAAQIEIERKKLRIAPHYNKGPAQYVTDGIDLTTLGKKV